MWYKATDSKCKRTCKAVRTICHLYLAHMLAAKPNLQSRALVGFVVCPCPVRISLMLCAWNFLSAKPSASSGRKLWTILWTKFMALSVGSTVEISVPLGFCFRQAQSNLLVHGTVEFEPFGEKKKKECWHDLVCKARICRWCTFSPCIFLLLMKEWVGKKKMQHCGSDNASALAPKIIQRCKA